MSVSEIVDLFNSDRDSDECGTVRDEDDGFITTETVFSSSSTNFVVGGGDDDGDDEKEERRGTEENSEATTAMFNKYLNDFHEHFWYIVVIVCLSVILLFRRCFCSSSKNGSVSRTYLQRRDFSQTPQSVVEKRPLLKREKKNVPHVVDGFLMKKDNIEMTTVSSVVVPEGSIIGDVVMRERVVTSSSIGEKSLLKDL